MVYTLVLEANAERIESSSLSLRTKFYTTEVGSVRQGDPIAHVVSIIIFGVALS